MTQPAVNLTEIEGALGVLPESDGKALCIISVCRGATLAVNTPAAFGGSGQAAMQAATGKGPGTQLAARYQSVYGKSVLFVRSGATVAGSYNTAVGAVAGTIGAITKTGAGTSVFTDNASDPLVGGSWLLVFLTGGTRGVAGMVYQVLKDGISQGVFALGTDVTITIAGTQISLAIGAGTVLTGTTVDFLTTAPIPASAGTLADSGGGSSTITLAAIVAGTTEPDDDYRCKVRWTVGGTVGVTGMKVIWSLDDGATESAETEVGVSAFFIIPDSGGIKLTLGAGTITAGRTISFEANAPRWNNTELLAAINAAKASGIPWEILAICGPQDAASIDVVATAAPDKKHTWFVHTRNPVGAETDPNYQASLAGVFSTKSTSYVSFCSGACDLSSSIDGRRYVRPSMFGLVTLQASVGAEINIANIDDGGAIPGCSIRDDNGNPKHHDESLNPGLDDLRFQVLRTWDADTPGVFSNRPRVFSTVGSDFRLVPHRRIMNIMHQTMSIFLRHRLSKAIQVSRKTGYILPGEQREIQLGGEAALRSQLLTGKIKVSDVRVSVSGTDDLLRNAPMTGEYRAVPLAYPEFANFRGGFENPATAVVPF